MKRRQKFKTFASNQYANPQPNYGESLESFSPQLNKQKNQTHREYSNFNSPSSGQFESNNITQLKKQMEQALRSKRRQSSERERPSVRYPTEISLMKSDISVASTMLNEDIPLDLLSLELNVTENILALRQEKITLMEEYNKQIGEKYRVERQITKLQKMTERQSNQTNEDLKESAHTLKESIKKEMDPILKKNQQLKRQLRQIQQQTSFPQSPQQQEIIQSLQNKSKLLELQIKNISESYPQDKRFQTFFPEEKSQKNIHLLRQLQSLKKMKAQLLQNVASCYPSDIRRKIIGLIREKQDLQRKCDDLLNNQDNLSELRMKIAKEEEAKQIFFRDLKAFKEEMNKLKHENEILKFRQ